MVRTLIAIAAILLAPSAASAQAPDITDILSLREVGGFQSGLSVSPDGRQVAVFTRDTLIAADRYQYTLMVIPAAGGEARAIADGGDAILRTATGRFSGAIDDRIPAWSPDGSWISYIARHRDHIELWRVRPDGRANRRLVGGERDVARFAWLSGNEIVVELYPARSALSLQSERQRRLGFFADDNFEPRYNLFPYPNLRNGRSAIVIDTNGRKLRDATEADARALLPATGFGAPSGQVADDEAGDVRASIAPATPGDPATLPALALTLTRRGADIIRCEHSACSGRMSGVWIASDDQIVFQRREGHGFADYALYVWDVSADTIRLLRRADEVLLDCELARDALVCLHESPSQPRRLVTVSLSSGDISPIYDPNPNWSALPITRVERLEADDAYGNQGFAHLVWPRDYQAGRLYPMVVVQYRSRGFLRGGVGGEYPIHALAARGYFVLSVDRTDNQDLLVRLPAAQSQLVAELDGSELRMKQTQLEGLLRQIGERNIVDPARIAITGLSDGAETVFWMISQTRLFAAAVSSSPPVDPSGYPLNAETFRQSNRDVGAEGPWEDTPEPWASWWRENATIYHAENIRAPLLMNLSDNEALTGFPLSVRLRELGRVSEIYIYPGEYHVKWRPQHQLMAQERALAWIDFWLLGVERDDANEPGRIERWRALRARHAAALSH